MNYEINFFYRCNLFLALKIAKVYQNLSLDEFLDILLLEEDLQSLHFENFNFKDIFFTA